MLYPLVAVVVEVSVQLLDDPDYTCYHRQGSLVHGLQRDARMSANVATQKIPDLVTLTCGSELNFNFACMYMCM